MFKEDKFYSNFKVFAKEIKCSLIGSFKKYSNELKDWRKWNRKKKNSESQKQEKSHLRRKKRNTIKILLQKLLHKLLQE